MNREKITQNKNREPSIIKDEVETLREESKKLLSPKGAIDFAEHNSASFSLNLCSKLMIRIWDMYSNFIIIK